MTDLDRLIAAVEAGSFVADTERKVPRFNAFADAFEVALGMKPSYADGWGAYRGSLDAALRLHEALLPGMFWNMGHLDQPSLGYVCTVADGHFADSPSWRGYAMTPARSWLLAILRAVKARGE